MTALAALPLGARPADSAAGAHHWRLGGASGGFTFGTAKATPAASGFKFGSSQQAPAEQSGIKFGSAAGSRKRTTTEANAEEPQCQGKPMPKAAGPDTPSSAPQAAKRAKRKAGKPDAKEAAAAAEEDA